MCSRLGSTGMKISFELSNPNYGLGMLLKTGEIEAKISVNDKVRIIEGVKQFV